MRVWDKNKKKRSKTKRSKSKRKDYTKRRDRSRQKVQKKESFIKTIFFNYLRNFPYKFVRNCAIALILFIIVLVITQFDFPFNNSFSEYVYKMAVEGIDLTNINLEFIM